MDLVIVERLIWEKDDVGIVFFHLPSSIYPKMGWSTQSLQSINPSEWKYLEGVLIPMQGVAYELRKPGRRSGGVAFRHKGKSNDNPTLS